jgi:hypothetical protein
VLGDEHQLAVDIDRRRCNAGNCGSVIT